MPSCQIINNTDIVEDIYFLVLNTSLEYSKRAIWHFLIYHSMATANTHGEDHFVIMFGGLHVEMTAFKVLGKWLSGSGWTDVLTNASFLIASHLKGHDVHIR